MFRICSALLISTMTFLTLTGSALAHVPRFTVISDPHVYDTDLGTSGPAFEQYLAQDRKMLRESEAILVSTLERIKAQHPDFLLISGDLTKDGEKSGHKKLAGYLSELETSGIQVFVVPGNHDINNPHAVSFDGDETHPVPTVSPDDFADIYDEFGYNQAIYRDPSSLSYVAEPEDGVWLFAMDSCKYDNNMTNNYPETSGAFSEATLNWILDKLFEARIRHKTVLGLMHHGILEHYTGQSQLYKDYVIDNWETTAQTLSAAGLQLVFTGHYHANDITRSGWDANPLYDVETGSLVTYPSPYRLVDLHGRNAAAVHTFHIDSIDADTAGLPFTDYSREFLLQGIMTIATYQLSLPPAQGGFGFSMAEAQQESPYVAQAFMAHYSGDESPDAETLGRIGSYMGSADPRFQALGQSLGTLWTDLAPADNNALLTLNSPIALSVAGTYTTGAFDIGASEICAFDPLKQTLFVVNGDGKTIDMLDISNPAEPVLINTIDTTPYGHAPNSVAVSHGLVAVAVEADQAQDPGKVVVFNTDGDFLNSFEVGALPDMVLFTPDNRYILTANEGEPNADYTVDPEGSVSIINISRGIKRAKVRTAGFTSFNTKKDDLISKGVRIFGPHATVAQDLEPEYITVLPHSPYAWVSLQENNSIAKIHIATGRVMDIIPLGFKDHGLPENGLDASDKDNAIAIKPYEGVMGMYQPDAIAAYRYRGQTYLVTANEGDTRDYDGFSEDIRVKDLVLDPTAFPQAGQLQDKAALGRLTVTKTLGDIDGDGDYDKLYAFGGRSFSIFKVTSRGLTQVFDSGDQIEQIVAAVQPGHFNSDNDDNDSFDSRSDAKGPEPEGVTLGAIGNRTYAFIGLERMSGILVYDITSPFDPRFIQYIDNRNYTGSPEDSTAGDLGPEGIAFIPACQSPDGHPMLAVANEVSGSTTVYHIDTLGCSRDWHRESLDIKGILKSLIPLDINR